jgi:hypothetical protein
MEHRRHKKHHEQVHSDHAPHSKKVHHRSVHVNHRLTEGSKLALEAVGYRRKRYDRSAMHKGSRLVSPAFQEWHKEFSTKLKDLSLFHRSFMSRNLGAEVPGYHFNKNSKKFYYRRPVKVQYVKKTKAPRKVPVKKERKPRAPRKVRVKKEVIVVPAL